MATLELTKERKENWGAIDIFGDVGRIELFIFARNARHSFMAECSFFQVSTASVVKASELIDICPVINELLGKKCFIQAFKYEGKLNFKGDIFQEISVEDNAMEVDPFVRGTKFIQNAWKRRKQKRRWL